MNIVNAFNKPSEFSMNDCSCNFEVHDSFGFICEIPQWFTQFVFDYNKLSSTWNVGTSLFVCCFFFVPFKWDFLLESIMLLLSTFHSKLQKITREFVFSLKLRDCPLAGFKISWIVFSKSFLVSRSKRDRWIGGRTDHMQVIAYLICGEKKWLFV